MKISNRDADKFLVRLPEGMRDTIKERARKNLRSMNSEIIFQLAKAYGEAGAAPSKSNGPGVSSTEAVDLNSYPQR